MIELFSADTPNGKKITIMLEEIGYDYKLTKIDLNKGEQFSPDFKKKVLLVKFQLLLITKIIRRRCLSLVQF